MSASEQARAKRGATDQTGGLFTLGETLAVFIPQDGAALGGAAAYRRTVAGSEANVAVAVTRLGLPARLVTVVGRDGLGDAVEHTLVDWGIDARVGHSDRPTGVLVRDLATDSSASAVHLRSGSAATELAPQHVEAAWAPNFAAVFVTGITAVRSPSALEAVQCTVGLARRAGSLVICDPNYRPILAAPQVFRDALSTLRGQVDVAIGDANELALLSGTSPRAAANALLDQGCRLVITKLGADGARAQDRSGDYYIPTRAAAVVDTVGAGDAFAGGAIVGLIEGATVNQMLELGSAIAARVVATAGDVEGLPLRGELGHVR